MSATLVAGLPSESAVDFDVGKKFFLFQFVVVFLFVTIIQAMSSGGGDSMSDELPVVSLARQMVNNPSQIPTWLGTSIPQVVKLSPNQIAVFTIFSTCPQTTHEPITLLKDTDLRLICSLGNYVCRYQHTFNTSL